MSIVMIVKVGGFTILDFPSAGPDSKYILVAPRTRFSF